MASNSLLSRIPVGRIPGAGLLGLADVVDLRGKVAAVTGGARGIGRSITEALVAEGMTVGIGDLNLPGAVATASEIGEESVAAFELDVTSLESVHRFVGDVQERFGPLDVLINNAGIMMVGELAKEEPRTTDLQIDVNIRGVLNGCKAALAVMGDRGDGHIVNIASAAGKFGSPRLVTYTATKHAVVGISDSLRNEVKDQGISVSTVMPIPVNTALGGGLGASMFPAVEPDDVARQVVRLLKRRKNEAFVPSYLEFVAASTRWMPSELRESANNLFKANEVMLGADDAARESYQREALETQRARR